MPFRGKYYIKFKYTSLRNWQFLKDIFYFAVAAFGGPQVHLSMMLDILVEKRGYISKNELLELLALCRFLPGPSSTQTLTAIGYKRGGPLLAFLTVIIWILPAALVMTGIVLLFGFFTKQAISTHFLTFIHPMAVGFVAFAGYRLTRSLLDSTGAAVIFIIATFVTIAIRSPWVPPLVLLGGGIISNFIDKRISYHKPQLKIKWSTLIVFFAILLLAVILGAITRYKPILLFENMYRFGSMVYGGGYVLIPMMYEQFVVHKQYMTSQEFLTGVGLMQAVPGPVFSFSTYAGGVSLKDFGMMGRILGAFIGTVGIFVPGTLLIFFVYPFWKELKKFTLIKRAVKGVTVGSAGLIAAAAFVLFWSMGWEIPDGTYPFTFEAFFYFWTMPQNWLNLLVLIITFSLLEFTRIPPPIIVLVALGAGFIW